MAGTYLSDSSFVAAGKRKRTQEIKEGDRFFSITKNALLSLSLSLL
jgi:hypothetical protein